MPGPETRLQRKIREALTERFPGIFLFKVHGNQFQASGLPDIIGCLRGSFIGIEVKMPGNKPTPLQVRMIETIKAAGGHATWVTSKEQAVAFVEGVASALPEAFRPGSN